MLNTQEKKDILDLVFMLGLLGLWYILEWYKEKSGQSGRRG